MLLLWWRLRATASATGEPLWAVPAGGCACPNCGQDTHPREWKKKKNQTMQSLSHLTPRANSRAVLGRQTPQGKLWQPWPCPPKLESLCREKRCCSRYWRSTGWKRTKENYSSFEVHTHLTANLSDPAEAATCSAFRVYRGAGLYQGSVSI